MVDSATAFFSKTRTFLNEYQGDWDSDGGFWEKYEIKLETDGKAQINYESFSARYNYTSSSETTKTYIKSGTYMVESNIPMRVTIYLTSSSESTENKCGYKDIPNESYQDKPIAETCYLTKDDSGFIKLDGLDFGPNLENETITEIWLKFLTLELIIYIFWLFL